jgi:hypothetical protein
MRSQQVGKIETDMQMAGVEVGPALPQFQYRADNSPTTQQITRTPSRRRSNAISHQHDLGLEVRVVGKMFGVYIHVASSVESSHVHPKSYNTSKSPST